MGFVSMLKSTYYFFVKDCLKIDIEELGPKIENYKYFPERTNVTVAQILDKKISK